VRGIEALPVFLCCILCYSCSHLRPSWLLCYTWRLMHRLKHARSSLTQSTKTPRPNGARSQPHRRRTLQPVLRLRVYTMIRNDSERATVTVRTTCAASSGSDMYAPILVKSSLRLCQCADVANLDHDPARTSTRAALLGRALLESFLKVPV
jgi:hypothetical protein